MDSPKACHPQTGPGRYCFQTFTSVVRKAASLRSNLMTIRREAYPCYSHGFPFSCCPPENNLNLSLPLPVVIASDLYILNIPLCAKQ